MSGPVHLFKVYLSVYDQGRAQFDIGQPLCGKGLKSAVECFEMFMNDDRWDGIPMVLETPRAEETYAEKLRVLRSLIRD